MSEGEAEALGEEGLCNHVGIGDCVPGLQGVVRWPMCVLPQGGAGCGQTGVPAKAPGGAGVMGWSLGWPGRLQFGWE